MDWEGIDWNALKRLRSGFLERGGEAADYWKSESDLANYDLTFAQRIGWKWDYVLTDLQHLGWSPPRAELLDWGCGSGIASRAFIDFFGADAITSLKLHDRSPLAVRFAVRRAVAKYPGLRIETGVDAEAAATEAQGDHPVLLISHVLNELSQPETEALVAIAERASCVIWVEPGTYEASYALVAIREKLRAQFNVIAPCAHQARCGLLQPGNERHWCHHFASPPPEVFTDRRWARFANELGIDLRDLAVSFLMLDRRPAPQLPPGTTRVIGHPRIYKPHALLLGCNEAGVRECRLTKRTFPNEFKRLRKGATYPLQVWQCSGAEIAAFREALPHRSATMPPPSGG